MNDISIYGLPTSLLRLVRMMWFVVCIVLAGREVVPWWLFVILASAGWIALEFRNSRVVIALGDAGIASQGRRIPWDRIGSVDVDDSYVCVRMKHSVKGSPDGEDLPLYLPGRNLVDARATADIIEFLRRARGRYPTSGHELRKREVSE